MNSKSRPTMKSNNTPFRIVAAASVAILWLFGPLAAAQPTEPLASLMKELTVRVQTFDTSAGQSLDEGCGIIIGFDDTALTILTARHVVESATAAKDGVIAKIRYLGAAGWQDAVSCEALGEDKLDAAIIKAKRKDSPFGRAPPCTDLIVCPAPPRGSRVSALGANLTPDENAPLTGWTPGIFNALSDGVCSFDADGIKSGYSGGPLVSDVGLVGLTIRAGANGQNHQALEIGPLLRAAAAKNLPVAISDNPAIGALTYLFDQKSLVAAVDLWTKPGHPGAPSSSWIALVPVNVESGVYTFNALTVRDHCRARISLSGGDLILDLDKEMLGHWDVGELLPSGRLTFSPQAQDSIPGLLVLSGQTDDHSFYIALPLKNTELLAARAIVTAAPDGEPRFDSFDRRKAFPEYCAYINGKPMPFCTHMCLDAAANFLLQAVNHRDKPSVLVGNMFSTDAQQEIDAGARPEAQPNWEKLHLHILDRRDKRAFADRSMPWNDSEIRFSIPPTDHMLRFEHIPVHNSIRGHITGISRSISALRIEYAPP